MDNKIILQFIRKDLDELQLLTNALEQEEKLNPMYIDLAMSKIRTLQNELSLLSTSNAKTENVEITVSSIVETISETQKTDTISIEQEIPLPIKQTVEPVEVDEKEEIVEQTPPVEKDKKEVQSISEPTIEKEDAPPINEVVEEILNTDKQIVEEKVTVSIEETFVKVSSPKVQADEVKKILAETFVKEPSLNEKLSGMKNQESKVKAVPVTKLKNAIGINDRFLFQRELFENNPAIFEETIHAIDTLNSLTEAVDYLEKNFQWNKNDNSVKFLELIKRRFQN